eukprot:CAMPEP_0171329032 /NCGR_PEP_ID=MMETSP0878-20121228/979_1 /TAXON_ID=67004 /ORGANISM="Thalassiosira weissflogii, Strain CCMP1336" /LENGTH=1264 /DNA_ID=CAMNT_0011828921 /DNA_START=127 /DNA_END=3921 /DNA_ORIENTATION=-
MIKAANVLLVISVIRSADAWSLSPHHRRLVLPSINKVTSRNEFSNCTMMCQAAVNTRMHMQINHRSGGLHAIMGASPPDDDNENPENSEEQRTRKRDILKKKLGLGGTSSDSASSSSSDDYGSDSIKFRKQGEVVEKSFMSPEEEAAFIREYEKKKKEGEDFVVKKMEEDNYQFRKAGVTEEDARKIADYIVELREEKERREINEARKKQTLEQWERERREREEKMVEEVVKDGKDYIPDRDPIAREIKADLDMELNERDQKNRKLEELAKYREMMERQKDEMAQTKIFKYSSQNTNVDDVLEDSVNELKLSRKEKLGSRDLGIFANTVELEESAEYIRIRKEEKKLQEEINLEWEKSGEDGEIVEPRDFYEKQRFFFISKKILDERDEEPIVSEGSGGNNIVNENDIWPLDSIDQQDKKLTPREYVLAYKRLNSWREYKRVEQAKREFLDGPERTPSAIGWMEMAILKQEEENRIPEILRNQLKTDDGIEDASNDVLMRELMQEGVTNERAIRLIDKLIRRRNGNSEDDAITGFLNYMKEKLLTEKDQAPKPARNSGSNSVHVNELLSKSVFDEPSQNLDWSMPTSDTPSSPSESSIADAPSVEKNVDVVKPEEIESINEASSSEHEQTIDYDIPPPPDSPFFQAVKAERPSAISDEDLVKSMFKNYVKKKGDDEDTRRKQQDAFIEFLKYEEQTKKKMEAMSVDSPTDLKDADKYVEDVLSGMKPRPSKPKSNDFMSEEDFDRIRDMERREGGFIGDDDDFDDDFDSMPEQAKFLSSKLPDWYVNEQQELGFKIEAENEGLSDEDIDKMIEERQKLADEYLKKLAEDDPAGAVLETLTSGDIDDDDAYDRRPDPLFMSFEDRKNELLEYNELTVEDVNTAMYYKVQTTASGLNPSLYGRETPFANYGALFRLEGVLVDMTGLHVKAWERVAEEHGYAIESSDIVRQASIYNAEVAAHRVFAWTNDIFEWENIADSHCLAFREAFNSWLESGGNIGSSSSDLPQAGPTREELSSIDGIVMRRIADKLGKSRPSDEDVIRALEGGWVEGMRDVLGWTSDPKVVDSIVADYGEMWDEEYDALVESYEDGSRDDATPDVLLQEGVTEWLDLLRTGDVPCVVMSYLDAGQLDEILRRTGLDEFFPPDKRVSRSNGFVETTDELLGAALRAERRTDHCVVFDNTPISATDAHEAQMKSISFVDHYAKYELTSADATFVSPREMNLMRLRTFFETQDLVVEAEVDALSTLEKKDTLTLTRYDYLEGRDG